MSMKSIPNEPRYWGLQGYTCFLSHLLIAGCDIGVQISVRLFVRLSVHPSVRLSTLCGSLTFMWKLVSSASVIAAKVKLCIVIVHDIPFKHNTP